MRSYSDLKEWPIIRWLPWQKSGGYANREHTLKLSKRLPRHFFKTKRLTFRPLSPDDLSPLLEIVSKPDVIAYVDDGQPMDEELVSRWIEFSRRNVAIHGSGTGALILRSSGELIGWAGLSRPAMTPPEIVYGLDSPYWGMGFGQEIANALVKWCKTDLGMTEIHASVYSENTGSIRILENLKFRYMDDQINDDGSVSRLYVRRGPL
ncbi:MAG: GNAT family N-acetyltransferase [Methyloligellaceae bacterium]